MCPNDSSYCERCWCSNSSLFQWASIHSKTSSSSSNVDRSVAFVMSLHLFSIYLSVCLSVCVSIKASADRVSFSWLYDRHTHTHNRPAVDSPTLVGHRSNVLHSSRIQQTRRHSTWFDQSINISIEFIFISSVLKIETLSLSNFIYEPVVADGSGKDDRDAIWFFSGSNYRPSGSHQQRPLFSIFHFYFCCLCVFFSTRDCLATIIYLESSIQTKVQWKKVNNTSRVKSYSRQPEKYKYK